MYGSIRLSDMKMLLFDLFSGVGDRQSCIFIDVGCGIGRVLAIVWASCGVDTLYGFEFDDVKVEKCKLFVRLFCDKYEELQTSQGQVEEKCTSVFSPIIINCDVATCDIF